MERIEKHLHRKKACEEKRHADSRNVYFLLTEPAICYARQWKKYHSKLRAFEPHLKHGKSLVEDEEDEAHL